MPISDGTFADPAPGRAASVAGNGAQTDLVLTISGDSSSVADGDIGMTLKPQGATTGPAGSGPSNSDGGTTLDPGGAAKTSGYGFKPGSTVEVWLLTGTPVLLGTTVVAPDGTFTYDFVLPQDVDAGHHVVQVEGISVEGTERALSVGVSVMGVTVESLAFTGSADRGLALLALALLASGIVTVTGVRRKRRSDPSAA